MKSVLGEGEQEIIIHREAFQSDEGTTLEWSKIATFEISIVDAETKQKLDLTSRGDDAVLQSIQLVD